MTTSILLVLKVSIVSLIFAIGLGSTPSDLAYLWRRPVQLVRSILAMYVVVPLVALTVVKLLPLGAAVETAILVLAISAGAPMLPKKLMKIGRQGFVFSLVVTSSLLAIVVVPAWLAVIGPLLGRASTVNPSAVALALAKAFLAPLLVGMFLRWPLEKVAERLSEWILGAAGATLAVAGLALLASHFNLLLAVGWIPLLALAGMTAVALAIGHALGGPDPGDRTALAVCCSTRHIGIAMLAASTAPGPKVIALVLAYAIASAAVSIPYLRWRRRSQGPGSFPKGPVAVSIATPEKQNPEEPIT